MEVVDLVRKYGLRRCLSQRTIDTYTECIKNFVKYCNKELKQVNRKDIEGYLDSLVERSSSGSTLHVHLNALKFLFHGILGKNVLIKIKYAKRPKRLPAVLSKEEIIALFAAIKNTNHRLMIELMYSSGLRLSELVNLKVCDLEINRSYGWVRHGKGNKDRMFILAERIKQKIVEHIAGSNLGYDSFLFNGRKGHIHHRTVQEIVKLAAYKAGIKKSVHPHTLRHSFATHLIEQGHPLAAIQSLLGHNSVQTTMVYVHLAVPQMINVVSPFDKL